MISLGAVLIGPRTSLIDVRNKIYAIIERLSGDAILAEFQSVVAATTAALTNDSQPPRQPRH